MASDACVRYVGRAVRILDDVAVRHTDVVGLAVDGVGDTSAVHVTSEVEEAPLGAVNALAFVVARSVASGVGDAVAIYYAFLFGAVPLELQTVPPLREGVQR